ncbi:Oidioi.mRNA.OKI2018_I69.chr2.g7332.t1.cds [Oikopleura dioica]|uniref:Oidioi.mRNA.OKI2018_I69.chr2.g7332.t1.cds n=1 Tax=Oikopleura dioica TaxID=34765 RepID=A0ABN7T6H0_OIKDI|nr:Oidioi.mRNA.OKI2018_I69.chr2.g7332.t1.cds [Oikopleura dioica]
MPAKKKTYQKENLDGVMTRAARRMKKAYEEAKVTLSPSARSPTPSGDFTTPLSSPIRTEDEKAKKAQQHPGPRVMSNKQIIFSVSVALLAIVAFQVGRSDWGQEKVRIMQNAWEDQRVQWLEENPTLDAIVKMFSKKAESLDLAKMWNELTWENVKEKMTWTEVKEAISASSFEIKREEYKIASWFNAVKAAWYEEDDQQED